MDLTGVKTSKKKGRKHRKYGRNLAKCKRYRDQERRRKNKLRRILKDLKRNKKTYA